ncbi:DEAD/DEAH box helicase [Actinoplanes bogorensis]|uniref:DNA 3'-5' helicase n=1 Tax=Paractinoplanes bogorensis TaxID=1610840 RepID=A0ABS5YL00_9ACTN|nr:DEAD/DEAH box helicase [Actinoplanes bogorensis]MBU2664006.1 DEAD/DEAH box helicase [Actinoplanes bogorensis]
MADAGEIARSVFGFDLRPVQRETVAAVVAGRDTLAVLLTGSGKSAIYQVAGLARGGLTVVVSPLLALQRDQLRSLTERKVPARMLNSGMRHTDRTGALADIRTGKTELLAYFGEHYPAPCGNCDNDRAPSPAPSRDGGGDGVRVRHKLWGPGLLLTRDEHELTVLFDAVGYRHLTPAVLTNGLLALE